MTDPSGTPEPAVQEHPKPAYSEMDDRPDPVYPKDLSKAMLLAAVFGPVGLFYTAPEPALVLLAAVFLATFINLDNAGDAWLLATGVSFLIAHYVVKKNNSRIAK